MHIKHLDGEDKTNSEICELLHSLPSTCIFVHKRHQPIVACKQATKSTRNYYTRHTLHAPPANSIRPRWLHLKRHGKLKLTHVARRKLYIGCRKGGVVARLCLKPAVRSSRRTLNAGAGHRRRHETLFLAGAGEDGYAFGWRRALTAALSLR